VRWSLGLAGIPIQSSATPSLHPRTCYTCNNAALHAPDLVVREPPLRTLSHGPVQPIAYKMARSSL
jgi:hypothetical protein